MQYRQNTIPQSFAPQNPAPFTQGGLITPDSVIVLPVIASQSTDWRGNLKKAV